MRDAGGGNQLFNVVPKGADQNGFCTIGRFSESRESMSTARSSRRLLRPSGSGLPELAQPGREPRSAAKTS